MNKPKINIVRPTPEEEKSIASQLVEDTDTYEWTDEDWANAKSTQELFPDLAEWAKQRKADLEAGLIEHVTLTLDKDTINWLKTQTGEDGETGGTRWMRLAAQTLRDHAVGRGEPQ